VTLRYDRLPDLASRYDAFLIDQFGVLIGGDGAYPGAAAALAHVARSGTPVIVLSNSGKRSGPNRDRLVSHGFDRGDFRTVLTSGEVAHDHLAAALGDTIAPGAKVLVLIRDGDTPPTDGLDLTRTGDPAAADLLLIVSRDPARALSWYDPILDRLAARDVPALCVNPDIHMLTPRGLMPSAGHLAALYVQRGGHVDWFGKPHPPIYARAKAMLAPIDPARILCIGDSLAHDIAGGQAAGCKTALVRTGVHANLSDRELAQRIAEQRAPPDHVLRAFEV